ncbi:MAG: GNAT family N-acetyltransferase [Cocleimonas sp.]
MQIQKLQWQQTLTIRQAVLWPEKPQEFCHVEDDEQALHYGVYIDQALVCVASVYPEVVISINSNNSARLRKFATLVAYQNQGVGSFVLSHIIDSLKTEGISNLWCDARESAIEFYQRFGFQTEGQRFHKGNIPYFKMQMTIS